DPGEEDDGQRRGRAKPVSRRIDTRGERRERPSGKAEDKPEQTRRKPDKPPRRSPAARDDAKERRRPLKEDSRQRQPETGVPDVDETKLDDIRPWDGPADHGSAPNRPSGRKPKQPGRRTTRRPDKP
ncbi:MAG: hypothetical protein KKB37_14205, partial [Alphaproteobacteria bacterium]|nr:hypothetical protein [Alphaproteobacteria bacterium]